MYDVSQYNQYLRKIHVNIFSLTVIKKNPVFLLGMFKTLLEYYFYLPHCP